MTVALLAAVAFVGCTKEYTITVKSNNESWGTVTGGGSYADGATATLSAIPAAGYYFISWQDGDRTNPRTVTVTANATYIATFSNDPNGGGDNPGGGGNDPLQMSGTISQNVTWPDRGLAVDYIIDGVLDIDGNALLTIDPGVTIMFTNVNGAIVVGENAGLKMVGTADKPIILQGPTNNPNNGSWDRIKIYSKRNDNQFEYVQFLRGGSADDVEWWGVVNVSGKLSMKHCTLDGGLKTGLVLEEDGYLTAFENNVIKNCAGCPIYTESINNICKNIGTGNTFTRNGDNRVKVNWGYPSESENLTLRAIGIPYAVLGSVGYDSPKTLTIEAGTIIEMQPNEGFGISGGIVMNGTAGNPIVFRCENNTENWNGIDFSSTRNGNQMNYVQIQRGGASDDWTSQSCLYIRVGSKLSMTGCSFGSSARYGVSIEYIGSWYSNINHSGCTFSGCTLGNVYLDGGGEWDGTEYEGGEVLDALP